MKKGFNWFLIAAALVSVAAAFQTAFAQDVTAIRERVQNCRGDSSCLTQVMFNCINGRRADTGCLSVVMTQTVQVFDQEIDNRDSHIANLQGQLQRLEGEVQNLRQQLAAATAAGSGGQSTVIAPVAPVTPVVPMIGFQPVSIYFYNSRDCADVSLVGSAMSITSPEACINHPDGGVRVRAFRIVGHGGACIPTQDTLSGACRRAVGGFIR